MVNDNVTSEVIINREPFGEYYPYRDSCSKPNDPSCITNVPVLNKVLKMHPTANISRIILRDFSHIVLDDTISFSDNVTLTMAELECSYYAQYWIIHFFINSECEAKCSQYHGLWNSIDHLCAITVYLNRVCIRVRLDPTTERLVADHAPSYVRVGEWLYIDCMIWEVKVELAVRCIRRIIPL